MERNLHHEIACARTLDKNKTISMILQQPCSLGMTPGDIVLFSLLLRTKRNNHERTSFATVEELKEKTLNEFQGLNAPESAFL